MAEHKDLSSGPKVAKASGVSQKTINNMEHGRHNTKLTSIEKVARAFGIEAFQLLCGAADKDFLLLCRAYNVTDQRGRETLADNADILLRRAGRDGRSETGEASDR